MSKIRNGVIKLYCRQELYVYLKNTLWMMLEQAFRIISGLFVGIWVARYLGPEKFGLYSYIMACYAIMSGILKLGMDGVLVREFVNRPKLIDVYLGTGFWLKLISAIIGVGFVAFFFPLISNEKIENQYILVISVGMLFQSVEVMEFYFQSQLLAKVVSICKVTQLILSSMLKIFLVTVGANMSWFILMGVFDLIMLAFSYCIANIIHRRMSFWKYFSAKIAVALLKDAWPLLLSTIVIIIYTRIDLMLIKDMIGDYEAGVYSAAVRLVEAWYFIPVVVANSLFPAILDAKNVEQEFYYTRLQGLYRLIVYLGVVITILMYMFSDLLVVNLFGQNYLMASEVLKLYVLGIVFVFFGTVRSKWILAENLQKYGFYYVFFGGVVNVLLGYVLIKKLGILGGAISNLVSLVCVVIVFPLFNRRVRSSVPMFFRSFILSF
ncbi:flippase [Methylomonas koyamae]|uniref:flippase n=1 Tax=Methylomonas koyamae TaxID=702114 RepID=UPI0028731610|nr:flippase [Methylomonas koyamae]WNB74222.1 flippase [Methylomonas koyamae]